MYTLGYRLSLHFDVICDQLLTRPVRQHGIYIFIYKMKWRLLCSFKVLSYQPVSSCHVETVTELAGDSECHRLHGLCTSLHVRSVYMYKPVTLCVVVPDSVKAAWSI